MWANWLTGAPTIRVAVIDTATGAQIGTTPTLASDDYPLHSPMVTADGARVLMLARVNNNVAANTSSTRVAVINTATGAQVGTPLTLDGEGSVQPVLSADSARAVVVTTPRTRGPATDGARVTVIDTATGGRLGATVTVAGTPTGSPALSVRGSRAVTATHADDFDAGGALVEQSYSEPPGNATMIVASPRMRRQRAAMAALSVNAVTPNARMA